MKITPEAIPSPMGFEQRYSASCSSARVARRPRRGFTLIELLVVITIIGILATIVVANLEGLIGGAEKTETKARFQSYLTAIGQYKQSYTYYPRFLSEEPVDLSIPANRDKFIMSLKGRKLVGDKWDVLAGEEIKFNKKSREFHPFTSEAEFDDENFLIDFWGNRHIKIIVDRDRDGFIQLPSVEGVDALDGGRVKENAVMYVLAKDDPEKGGKDVFSWATDED